jgi:DNA-binding MarR family transcriptional regulator
MRSGGAVPRDEVDAVVAQWARVRPDTDPASIGIFGRLSRLHLTERGIVRTLYDQHGLTPAAFEVLSTLRRCGPPHRATAGELADSALLSTGGMTFRIDKLEKEELVRRIRAPEDRRLVLVELTEAGLTTIDRVYDEHIAREQEMLAALTPTERERLADLLRKLGHSVRRQSGASGS